MFLTVHTPLGIIIGQSVSNPILAFLLGIVSHYLFDIIPHGDTKISKKYQNPIHIAAAGMIDVFIIIIYLLILFFLNVQFLKINIILAIIGSWLPDIIQAFYFRFQGNILSKLQNFHNFLHNLIANKYQFKLIHGLVFQIIILILLTIILI